MQENHYTPKYGNHGNLIKSQLRTTQCNNKLEITIQCSDILCSQYQGYSSDLQSVKLDEIMIMRKDLDQPLSFFKNIFAKMSNIKAQHQFILLSNQSFAVSIDYYIGNRIVIRLGDYGFVLDQHSQSKARKQSSVLREKNGLEWRRVVKKDEQLTLGTVINHILTTKFKGFSQLYYTGTHFSHELFNTIQYNLIKSKAFLN